MTELSVARQEYLRKAGVDWNGDLLREGVSVLLQVLMEHEVSQQIGAERYERNAKREAYRNGFREGSWETRVGEIPLRIPELRSGNYYLSFLEPRRRAERSRRPRGAPGRCPRAGGSGSPGCRRSRGRAAVPGHRRRRQADVPHEPALISAHDLRPIWQDRRICVLFVEPSFPFS